jgi:hypothetical protein
MLNVLLALTLTGNSGVNPEIKPTPAAMSQVENAGSKTIVFNGQEYRVSVIEVGSNLAKALEKDLNTNGTPKWLEKFYENPELPLEF